MKLNTAALCLLIAVIAITSCKKDSPSGNSNPKTTTPPDTTKTVTIPPSLPTDADVYFAGSADVNSSGDVATYWKNDTLKTVSNLSAGLESEADAILVNNGDVYIAGSTHGTSLTPVIWKNGTPSILPGNISPGSGYALALAADANNNIYAAGSSSNSQNVGVATYWKNGAITQIAPMNSTSSACANAIAINGNDVYLAGYTFDTMKGNYIATVWKNGVATLIAAVGSKASGISVSGSDVYIVGEISGHATFWKNGTATTLDNGNSEAYAIVVSGSDVHVAGLVNEMPTYWKNGVETTLPGSLDMVTQVIALAVRGSDVYIAGGVDSNGNSIFWINGKQAPLIKGLSTIRAMTIVSH